MEERLLAIALASTFDIPYVVWMIRFAWDDAKAAANLRRHGVSFEEARTVFYDEFAVQLTKVNGPTESGP